MPNLKQSSQKCLVVHPWIKCEKNLHYKGFTTSSNEITKASGIPHWSYDGSRAEHTPGGRSQVVLEAASIYHDTLKSTPARVFVFDASMLGADGDDLLLTNNSYLMTAIDNLKVWSKFEEEYCQKKNPKTNKRVFFLGPAEGARAKRNACYREVNSEDVFGRDFFEVHCNPYWYAGFKISTGIDGEFCSGNWERYIGRAVSDGQDDMVRARWDICINRVEVTSLIVNLDTKLVNGDKSIIQECVCMKCILPAMTEPENNHADHIDIYQDGIADYFIEKQETENVNAFNDIVYDCRARLAGAPFEKRFKSWIIHLIWWLALQFPVALANEFNCVCGKSPSASAIATVAIIIAIIGAVAQIIVALINKKL